MGSEFEILIKKPLDEIGKVGGERLRQALEKVRSGDIVIEPGYDGLFGKVKIWKGSKDKIEKDKLKQTALF